MPETTLTLFAPKAPVEPTSPSKDSSNDNGSDFKDFMDTATHKVDSVQKSSKEDSAQNQNNNQAAKSQNKKGKPNTKSKIEESSESRQKVSAQKDNPSKSKLETVLKNSLIEENGILAAQLQELDIGQTQFALLLDLLGLDGDTDADALLQSFSQAINLNENNSFTGTAQEDLITKIPQNKGEGIDFLKQAGFTDSEAKNFINKLSSLQKSPTEKKLGAELNTASENNQNENQEDLDFLTHLKNTKNSKETATINAKTEQVASIEKPAETSKKKDWVASTEKPAEIIRKSETPRVTSQEQQAVSKSGNKTSKLGELLSDKNVQANLVQTEDLNEGKAFKGLEVSKAGPDLQVQTPAATANTAIKAIESSKPILPENLLARGVSESKVIKQIVNKMKVSNNGTQNEIHIKLDPPSLGRVRMNITTSGDTVKTVIVAENQAVKQVIESNFNQLRDAMVDQGLKLNSFTVTVGGESPNQNQSREQFNEDNGSAPFNEIASGEIEENSESPIDNFFFEDNQSISVIA